jgi:hypothetical protein
MMAVGVAVVSSGCSLDRLILDGTLESNRKAASTFDTLSDLEVAKLAAASSLVQLEGMQRLAPDNEDGLYLLTNGWASYGGAFIEDDWEQAVDRGDDDAEAAQAKRAREAYERAVHFGTMLFEQKKPGFAAATKNDDTMKAYLASWQKNDAESLLWLGAAWLSRVGVAADDTALVSELFVGVALIERSVELDESLSYGLGLTVLGAYHARAPDAELPQAKALFEKALAMTGRKSLTSQVMMAQNYSCMAHDEPLYRALLNEVLAAPDQLLPEQRLENVIAKRKAQRYLGAPRLARCGFSSK